VQERIERSEGQRVMVDNEDERLPVGDRHDRSVEADFDRPLRSLHWRSSIASAKGMLSIAISPRPIAVIASTMRPLRPSTSSAIATSRALAAKREVCLSAVRSPPVAPRPCHAG
jgi:hypothetical protein